MVASTVYSFLSSVDFSASGNFCLFCSITWRAYCSWSSHLKRPDFALSWMRATPAWSLVTVSVLMSASVAMKSYLLDHKIEIVEQLLIGEQIVAGHGNKGQQVSCAACPHVPILLGPFHHLSRELRSQFHTWWSETLLHHRAWEGSSLVTDTTVVRLVSMM